MFQDQLRQQGISNERIITVNLDDFENKALRNPETLHQFVLNRCNDTDTYYIFIDEVQMCKNFLEVLASFSRHKNLDIYVTGSNAFLLSGELATLLTGRYSEIHLSTLSFAEFHSACKEDGLNPFDELLRYMRIGGFPAIIPYRNNDRLIQSYYEGLVSSIILKDICYRLKIRDASLLDRLATYLATSIGSVVSAKNIMNVFKHEGFDVSLPTVYGYLQALEDSYFSHRVPRFDIRGKTALRSEEKFYLCDVGFRYAMTSSPVRDYGHILENIVYLELQRRFKKVVIGRIGEREIDFVAESSDGFTYFQVAMSVMDPTTLERELSAFNSIRDAYPRYLITTDRIGSGRNFNGIIQLNAADWLLGIS